jgi:tetratricopeptide (TPR) repeat protein
LKLKNGSHSISIRACILVEKGISEKNRESVCQGLQVFEHLLATISVRPWHIFYNLGNALSALGRHQEAIALYKQALDLEQNTPDIWKNLASSYHLAGDHGLEMECFGKALELDPLKPEALVSKAVSLMIDFRKPEEALPLLETALRCGLDLPVRWPQIWYWLATAYLRNGRLQDCLKSADNGLAHRPGDLALRKLKSDVFVKLVQNGGFSGVARSFWKAELFREPKNYQTRCRLVRLEAERGDVSTAWDLLDECFALVELTPSASLQTSKCQISECITALRFLPQYAMFRSSFPVSDYWDHENPLYDLLREYRRL